MTAIDRPWLSVIMPVFNGARYVANALDSVLSQAADDVEIVVSDDGSTDGSLEIIERYAQQGRVVAIEGPRTGNWASNSNAAASQSKGSLVTILHQDDLWLPGRLAALRDAARDHPDRNLWVGPTRFIDSTGRFVGTWRLPFRRTLAEVGPALFVEHLLVQNFLGMPTPVFSRTAFDRVGGLDEELWFTADWDLWLKLGAESGAGIQPNATTAFRLHRQSQTVRRADSQDEMRRQISLVIDRHLVRLADLSTRLAVERAARFSCELNASLAGALAGHSIGWKPLLTKFAQLGYQGGRRFARDARIIERTLARLRTGLAGDRD